MEQFILRAIKELTQENISYTSDTGKNYDFNTADTLNTLLLNCMFASIFRKGNFEFYNLRGGKERIFDDMNNSFGWNRLPKSFMAENTVFLLLTALIRNFYKAIINIGATKASVLGVFEPITAILVGTLVFGEALTDNIIIGIVIATVAVTFMIISTKR